MRVRAFLRACVRGSSVSVACVSACLCVPRVPRVPRVSRVPPGPFRKRGDANCCFWSLVSQGHVASSGRLSSRGNPHSTNLGAVGGRPLSPWGV